MPGCAEPSQPSALNATRLIYSSTTFLVSTARSVLSLLFTAPGCILKCAHGRVQHPRESPQRRFTWPAYLFSLHQCCHRTKAISLSLRDNNGLRPSLLNASQQPNSTSIKH
eukprot:1160282-Pelagomonas_calceolata.AAC.5